uniref:Family with sequence similarity 110 member A n=1 Tax=Neolamprologus brichardi TaxID=32507 RepID=A0A3Q4H3X4_NEOBR
MPVETLQHSVRQPTETAVAPTPTRLRPKGPVGLDFYQKYQKAASRPKQSAVERLEADKAKYVKSQVALTKQQPVRPPEVRKPLLSPSSALSPTRKTLDMEHLSNLISGVNEAPRSGATAKPNDSKPPYCGAANKEKPSPGPPAAATVRRVDVMPQASPVRTAGRRPQKRPSLTRSKSDMSDRYSRAGTELERFFNLCGLDSADVQELTGSSSDIVSMARFRSASAPGSECAASGREDEGEEDEEEAGKAANRVPYGVSVIERNARVIKWLYGIKEAKDNSTKSTNL